LAKTAAHTTLAPNRFTPPNPPLVEDVVQALEVQNYAVTEECHTMAVLSFAAPGWGTTGDYVRTPLGARWGAVTGSPVRVVYGRVYIDADCQTVRIDVGVTLFTDDTGEAVVTIGGAAATLTYAATGVAGTVVHSRAGATTTNIERLTKSATLNVASTGTGWQDLEIEIEGTGSTGTWSSDAAGLDHATVQGVKVTAANLPDPD
jgi:hypothetical protein